MNNVKSGPLTKPTEESRLKQRIRSARVELKKNYQLFLLILIPVAYMIIFHYIPMYGAQIAFRQFRAVDGIWGSPWVGFDYFVRFFNTHMFSRVITNTLKISIYSLVAGFPIPIILALSLNNATNQRFRKIVQTTTYAPYFISVVVMVGILMQFLSPKIGIVNKIIETLGGTPRMFMAEPSMFTSVYVWSGIWQGAGWGTIIYLAALAGVDVSLHEAAVVDGASRLRRIWHIDLPGILPTMVIILILNAGQLMNVGFEKVILMQNAMNLQTSEIISTYVYKIGLASNLPNYSYGAAIGLFNSVINFFLILVVNQIAKKTTETSLW